MSENLRTTAGQSASKAFPKEVKSVAALAKEVERAYSAQRSRLESAAFIEHPLHGLLGRKLIWVVTVGVGCQGEDSVRCGRVVHKESGFWTDVMFLVLFKE